MPQNLTQKILAAHLVEGRLEPGAEIAIRIDQTLTQDATGTMAYLQLEAIGVPRVRTRRSVSYVDHNMLQTGYENADDHRYLQSVAARYGIYFSRPGNGICHQVQLERFSVPGETLLGADSHTPTSGGLGMLAIGAGGLDVAAAMAGAPFYLMMPRVTLVRLSGRLPEWVTAKDVIIELLRRLTVRGGVGRVMEYGGPGVATLSVPERATIANMGAELGATTSIFPSDEQTLAFLRAQGREGDWRLLAADPGAEYDEVIELDLSSLEPLVCLPSSPDNVRPVREVAGTPVAQVCIGSCTNSSYADLAGVAAILKGRSVHPGVSLTVSPGSRQVLAAIARSGALADLIAAGARILEAGCGPCIGMGQAPATGTASLRSFNRNFPGRSGTPGDQVYLASPLVCAASALRGVITDPRDLGAPPRVADPGPLAAEDNMIIPPPADGSAVEIVRGPNIKPLPRRGPLEEDLQGRVLLKVGDNISTDQIMPAGAKLLPLRSNVPALAEHVFAPIDPSFARRAREAGGGFVVGGQNYGQGSSREHAALCPMYLGVKAVFARSFARIHAANLVNFGILPLVLGEVADDVLMEGDEWRIPRVREQLASGGPLRVENLTQGKSFEVRHGLTPRQVQVLLAGGLLNYLRDA
ncbi:MAG: aconitate hydratase [Anaerolineae bacterium]|nr:aconitate hydratase [Anaerolineae bacterium]